MTETFDLAALGWSTALAEALPEGQEPARVVAQHRGEFDVRGERGEIRVAAPGRFLEGGDDIAVGDWVGLSGGRIQAVLPRRSALVRHAAGAATVSQTVAANVDIAFLVSSLGPDLDPRRMERYLVAIWESGARPEIVLTKADRVADPGPAVAEVERIAPGVPVHAVSGLTGAGCDEVRARIGPGGTAVLLGSSGVGKSTLVNRWVEREVMSTGPTREGDDKGRHTTTRRQMIALPTGGLVIDTPGLREFQLWESDATALAATFADVETLAAECRFADCSHTKEPGCAVLAALASGELAPGRLESWRKLKAELRSVVVRQDALARKEERRKWKLLIQDGEAQARAKRRSPRGS